MTNLDTSMTGVHVPQPINTTTSSTARKAKIHWVAAMFYLLLAVGGIVMASSGKPSGLVATAVAGAYSVYLFRGGRVVVWFW